MSHTTLPNELADQEKNRKRRGLLRVLIGISMLAGLVTIGLGLPQVYYGYVSTSWPTCEGTVMESESEFDSRRGVHEVKITYSYTVSGRKYTGHRHSYLGTVFSNSADAQKIVDEHPVGSPVTVYYSPNNPKMAVLAPGVQQRAWAGCVSGAIFVLIAIFMIWSTFRKSKKSEHEA